MMAADTMVRFCNVSFHYVGEHGTGEGVDDIDLSVARGETVLLCGRSGCGKTTLTRLLNGLAPNFFEGVMEGEVYVGNTCVTASELSQTASLVGSVFQNPKSQFFNVDTTGELAFGCENQALAHDEIHARVDMARRDMSLDALIDRNIFDLSGGEKQQIACGSVYAAQPQVYVLDEPSSNLDRGAVRRLHDILARIKARGGTIIVSEHRLHYLMDLVDRFVYLDDGRISAEFSARELCAMGDDRLRELGLRCTSLKGLARIGEPPPRCSAAPALEALDLSCNRGGAQIIDIGRLALPANSIIALIGDNGSGKSTLSEALCGVIPANGGVAFDGAYLNGKTRSTRSFMVMQDVNRQLFSESVIDEVMLNSDATREKAGEILMRLGLSGLEERHPASLSGGQKQRVAIASALCAGKDILFYDEPTSGLDRNGMELFSALLREMRARVGIQIIVTHDPELVMQACTHVLRIDNGRVTGFYPLDDGGVERVRYYFASEAGDNASRKRERVSMLGKIWGYVGDEKPKIIAAIALMTLGAACSLAPYLIACQLIDATACGRLPALANAAIPIAVIPACLVLHAVLYVLGLQLSHRAAFRTLENLRCSLAEKLEAQPLGNIQDMGMGAAKKLFVDDVESIELLLAHMIPEGIANIIVPVIALLVMAAVDWRLCLLTVAMVLFGMAATGQMHETGAERMGSYFAATKRLNNTIIEYVNGMEVVRVFNRSHESMERFRTSVLRYRDFALAWYRACWPWMATYGSIFLTCTLYTIPFGALLVLLGQLTLSGYVLVLCLSFGIGPLLSHLMSFASAIPQVNYKIQSLEKALDRPPLKVGDEAFHGVSTTVALDAVHFGYGNDEVLKGVSLTAEAGKMTALVGPSGSGKSTIAKLIAHYYDAESGSVSIGSQDVRDLSAAALSEQVSYVSQELFLFDKTIMENIRIGRPDATDEEVLAAARRARCDRFVSMLPDGYATRAGTTGGMLSGGQRQRISFARAILKDAPIIVLDEATAFIDPENAEEMNAAVRELVSNKTVIVIAHRLSSIVDADTIVVMDHGRVEASGTHAELLARCGLYRSLWDASEQAGAWTLKGGVAVC